MRISEIFKLVWLNLSQNKSKVILTSFGIVVGAATIMLVIAIGTGGREELVGQCFCQSLLRGDGHGRYGRNAEG